MVISLCAQSFTSTMRFLLPTLATTVVAVLSFEGVAVRAQLDLLGQSPNTESETDNSQSDTTYVSKLRRHPGNGATTNNAQTTVQQKRDEKLRAKSKKKPNPPKEDKNDKNPNPRVDVPQTDDLCKRFCNDYFEKCNGNNVFIVDFDSEEGDLERMTATKSMSPDYFDECERTCKLWPRPSDPRTFPTQLNQNGVNSATGGDTFWCRQEHLSLVTDSNNAAFHCPHTSNGGMGICRDSLVNGYTPYEWLRAYNDTEFDVLMCKVFNGGMIARCEDSNVNDANLPTILSALPANLEILFLNGNVGINTLPANIFRDHLKSPENLKALYLNDCEINSIDENALAGLTNLEIFDAAVNFVAVLPDNLLKPTPNLVQFQMFQNRLQAIPANFFSYTPQMERIAMYSNAAIDGFLPGTFDGLTKLKLLTFANCRIYSFNIPDTLFSDLRSLQFLDLFDNRLTEFKASWFDGGWASNLLRLAFQDNPDMSLVGEGAFESMHNLEVIYFHNTRVSERAEGFFDGSKVGFERMTVP